MKIIIGVFCSIIVISALFYIKYKNSIEKGISIISQLDDISEEYNQRPKQITKGNSMYLPLVLKIFPDFNEALISSNVEGFVKSYFDFLNTGDLEEFKEYNVLDSFLDIIRDVEKSDFNSFKKHDIAISNFKKKSEQLILEYQIAFEMKDSDVLKQYKGYISLVTVYGEEEELRCPHCGAPIEGELNICEYCETIVTRNSNKRWAFVSFKYK